MQSVCCSITLSVEKIAESVRNGSFQLHPVELFKKIIDMGLGQIHDLSGYLIIFFCLGILSTLVALFGKNSNSNVSNVSFFACYGAAAATAIKCFTICVEYANDAVGEMTDFITKLSPMLATLIIASGKSVSAAAFHPILSAAVYVVSLICHKCILPIASYAVILNVADNLGDHVRLSGVCRLMSSVSKWILALSFTLFTGVCAIYGFSAPSLDAVGAKTVKFAVGSLVPVVGGFLSETLETVITGSKLMKNSVGTAGLIVLCTICAMPVIKIGCMALVVRLSAAVCEPVCDQRISNLLLTVSSTITVLFGMVATVAVLFLICISIILAATG